MIDIPIGYAAEHWHYDSHWFFHFSTYNKNSAIDREDLLKHSNKG
ncbi:hypothetical protein FACS189425_01040 [Clostridia bacterium]|nr:hypothetical protein FACS189425_01040 [Clostridia bacterium]